MLSKPFARVIIGYSDLRRLAATIDTTSNTVIFSSPNTRFRSVPAVVSAVATRKLPACSHTTSTSPVLLLVPHLSKPNLPN
jgi:hypothetical protein